MILSVIIPVYNVEKYVESCIRSCENQDIPKEDYEVIVVNDGSPDGSLAIVQRLAREYSNIRVISQENGGLSAARNTGMENACGDYYMFVDSDDWIAENCLGKLTAKLRKENPDALAICAADVIDGVSIRSHSFTEETPIAGRDLLKNGISTCAPYAIWRASFFKKNNLKFCQGIYHEDTELIPRAYYLAEKVSRTNDIIYYYNQNITSITRTSNPKRAFDLIEVVCPNLSRFAMGVDNDYKVCFYDLVESCMNSALSVIQRADKKEKELLDAEIAKRSYLWKDIRKCSYLRYRIEACVACIFKKHPVKVYETLQKFKFQSPICK